MAKSRSITKAQLVALNKWSDGKSKNNTALKVRDDVHKRLVQGGYLEQTGWFLCGITDKGREALTEMESSDGV